MSRMKLGVVFPAALALMAALAAAPAELGQIQSVYLLSMSNGFDQYLANQLTTQEVFQVVTDPQIADAVLTDQIGLRFEAQLEDLYPAPPPPEETEVEAEGEEAEEGEDPEASEDAEASSDAEASEDVQQEAPPVYFSSFSRGRGNLFLVDRESRRVIWSTHERPKNSTPKVLNQSAERVVKRLKKTLTGQ